MHGSEETEIVSEKSTGSVATGPGATQTGSASTGLVATQTGSAEKSPKKEPNVRDILIRETLNKPKPETQILAGSLTAGSQVGVVGNHEEGAAANEQPFRSRDVHENDVSDCVNSSVLSDESFCGAKVREKLSFAKMTKSMLGSLALLGKWDPDESLSEPPAGEVEQVSVCELSFSAEMSSGADPTTLEFTVATPAL
jgi:hypothetical protein